MIGSAGTGDSIAEAVRDMILSEAGNPALLLSLGDQADPDGSELSYEKNFFPVYAPLLSRIPLFTISGDKEFNNLNTDAQTNTGPYFDLFDLPENGESGGLASNTEAYYSFNHSGIHFIALDTDGSTFTGGSDLSNWLQQDLDMDSSRWTVVLLHQSAYSKGNVDSDAESLPQSIRSDLISMLETGGVDLVVSSGSYSYERSRLLNQHLGLSAHLTNDMLADEGDGRPGGDGAYLKAEGEKGTVYVNLGTSARVGSGNLGHPAMASESLLPGAAKLMIAGDLLQMNFVDSTGMLVDSFQVRKGIRPEISLLSPTQGRHFDFPTNDVDIEVEAVALGVGEAQVLCAGDGVRSHCRTCGTVPHGARRGSGPAGHRGAAG